MSASDSVTPRLWVPHTEQHASFAYFFYGASSLREIVADFLTGFVGMAMAIWLDYVLPDNSQAPFSMHEFAAVCIGVPIIAVLLLHSDGAYRTGGSLLHIRETERTIRAAVQSVAVMLPFAFLLRMRLLTGALFIALAVIPIMLAAQKHAFATCARRLRQRGRSNDRAAVYGVGDAAKRVFSSLAYSHRLGLHPVVVIDDNPAPVESLMPQMGYRHRRSVPAQCGPVTSRLLKSYRCGALIVALPNLSPDRVAQAIDAAHEEGVRVALISGAELGTQQWTSTIDVDGLSLTPLLESYENQYYATAKRLLDLVASSLLLALFAPLFLLIALLVKFDSPGPAIFSQERVGHKGQLFRMYKFRSMYVQALPYDYSPTTPHDPRITRIGKLLRCTSLDELPQLVNVLLGNMSLVGPRPEMLFVVQGYTLEQRQRLQVLPGITGLWQLSADRAFPIHENIQYDLYYIRNRTFFMDIAILVHTLFFAVRGGI
jgi:exopolysaccharide biosynthesis polyprenyl glycosylphosphotransferase